VNDRFFWPEAPQPARRQWAGVGDEDQFAKPGLRGRCLFVQETFVGKYGNGRDAPVLDLPETLHLQQPTAPAGNALSVLRSVP
jgi:hypothetical protein